MNDAYTQYLESILRLLKSIDKKIVNIAADIIVKTIKNNHLIHVIGTSGHSYMAAEEMFWRAGGLVPVNPIFPSGFALAHGALRATFFERCKGYISAVLDYHSLQKGDTLIVVNSYGISSSTIEAALKGKEMGANIIAITSTKFCKRIHDNNPARHSNKKNLCDLKEVDLVIDNNMPADDAVVCFDKFEVNVSPVSTILNIFILNSIVGCVVEKLIEEKIDPPVLKSADLPGGDEFNKKYLTKYSGIIDCL